MARITFSALVTDIRGSIGGTTFQKNAYGYTVKNKPNMIKPNSRTQNFVKNWFVNGQRGWGLLTTEERASWDTWSAEFPQFAKNNLDSQLSGFQVFSRNYFYRQLYNLTALTEPSFDPTLIPSMDGTFSITKTASTTLNLTQPSWSDDSNYFLAASISSPIKASSSFISTKVRFILARTISDAAVNNIYNAYVSKFGFAPNSGDKVQLKVVIVNTESGLFTVIYNNFKTIG
jgi:hypothetical protein